MIHVEHSAKKCKVCGCAIPTRKSAYCSPACISIAYAAKPKIKTCSSCGMEFRALTSHKHCSKECRLASNRERCRKRREQIRITSRGRIDPIKVFNKHKWHCVQCGKPTPKELIGSFHNDSPTIDHIIPLSKGGTHTYTNLQLLCQYCNCSVKRDRIYRSGDTLCMQIPYDPGWLRP